MIKLTYKDSGDFDNHENAVQLKDYQVQEMVNDVLTNCVDMIKSRTSVYETYPCYEATGNTFVLGLVFDDDDDEELDTIEIYVFKNYEEACIYTNENGQLEKVNWQEDDERVELEQLSKDNLVDMIMKMKREAAYNPHREV